MSGKHYLLGIFRDITERKRAEESLRDTEQKYRTVFETTGTATVIIEEDGTISLVNAEFEKLCGYPKEDIEGKKNWIGFVAEEDMARMREYHRLRRFVPRMPGYEFEELLGIQVAQSGIIRWQWSTFLKIVSDLCDLKDGQSS